MPVCSWDPRVLRLSDVSTIPISQESLLHFLLRVLVRRPQAPKYPVLMYFPKPAEIDEEARDRAEGAYEAKHLGVSPGKKSRIGLDGDISSDLNEIAPAVLANIPFKCERCGSATAWVNDLYRPGILFVYCTRFRSRGPGCNWSTHLSATDPTPEGSSSSNPGAASSANPLPHVVIDDGAPRGLH